MVRDRALCALAGDELIATGHTASDQAETVLMRLLRGTGPDGLAAIAPRRGPFVRPLLAHTRAEIEAYVAAAGLDPWRDPMNADPRFTRVWLRQQKSCRRWPPGTRKSSARWRSWRRWSPTIAPRSRRWSTRWPPRSRAATGWPARRWPPRRRRSRGG